MAEKKSFGYYFEESMSSVGLSTPKGFYESSKKAAQTIGSILTCLATFNKAATITELAVAFEASAGAAAGSSTAAAGLFGGAGVMTAGLSAAAYVGCLLGALAYAGQMSTVGDVSDIVSDLKALITWAKKYSVPVPQKAEMWLIASTTSSKYSAKA